HCCRGWRGGGWHSCAEAYLQCVVLIRDDQHADDVNEIIAIGWKDSRPRERCILCLEHRASGSNDCQRKLICWTCDLNPQRLTLSGGQNITHLARCIHRTS